MEKRDLYDENRVPLGEVIFKGEDVPCGKYCLMVMVFIQNLDGRFLIQRRSLEKGGKWATTGGHPMASFNSYEGLLMEVKEELSLDISIYDVRLLKTKVGRGAICDVYYVKMPVCLDDIRCQSSEVMGVRLATVMEIKEMIEDGTFYKEHGKTFLSLLPLMEE